MESGSVKIYCEAFKFQDTEALWNPLGLLYVKNMALKEWFCDSVCKNSIFFCVMFSHAVYVSLQTNSLCTSDQKPGLVEVNALMAIGFWEKLDKRLR